MPNPIRLRVLMAMTTALSEISPGEGYAHDLRGRVFRGRRVFGTTDPVPMISILEAPIPLDQLPNPADGTDQKGQWELVVQGFVDDDRLNPTDPAHLLMAEVKQRLAQEKAKANWDRPEDGIFGLGRDVTDMYIGAGVVRPPDELSEKAFFWLQVTLAIVEDMADPYED
jgi:hypothetical protein